jgi:glutathione S-transferase
MDEINSQLEVAPGPYFLSEFGLVDITFAPFLERIVSSLLYYKGFAVRGEVRGEGCVWVVLCSRERAWA